MNNKSTGSRRFLSWLLNSYLLICFAAGFLYWAHLIWQYWTSAMPKWLLATMLALLLLSIIGAYVTNQIRSVSVPLLGIFFALSTGALYQFGILVQDSASAKQSSVERMTQSLENMASPQMMVLTIVLTALVILVIYAWLPKLTNKRKKSGV